MYYGGTKFVVRPYTVREAMLHVLWGNKVRSQTGHGASGVAARTYLFALLSVLLASY